MKTVLVTGSSRGIGRAAAQRFLRGGWRVYGCARHLPEKEDEIVHDHYRFVQADVSRADDVENIFRLIEKETDHLDCLINNAGVSVIGLLQDMSETQYEEVMNANLKSAFLLCRRALPGMIREQAGSIINISSMWGTEGASCEVIYSASKGGLNSFTKALAKEVSPSQITCNAIVCGVMDTRMNSVFSPDEKAALREEIGLGRFGKPQEAAELAYFLASDKARYLTGALIPLDGSFVG